MHAYLIVGNTKERESQINQLLTPLAIDPFDITRLSGEESIGITLVRQLKGKIALKPFKSKQKAIIIDEAQTLTIEAQNALLKTLEEPPDNTIIILLAANPDLLLPTILSRVQVITVKSPVRTLSAKEEKEMGDILDNLLSGKEDILKLAQIAGKDKATALLWLENMILYTRQKLIDNSSSSQYLIVVRSFQKAHTLLSTTNINPRFSLENLFLSL